VFDINNDGDEILVDVRCWGSESTSSPFCYWCLWNNLCCRPRRCPVCYAPASWGCLG